jgi:hypothetical protein
MADKKSPDHLEWEELKAIIDNFTPEEHAKFGEWVREYFREHGLDVLQRLEELEQSDDPDVAEEAKALIAHYWKYKDGKPVIN